MNEERSRFLLILYLGISLVCAHNSDVDFYTNEWVVHVPYGVTVAREVARNNDMEFIGPDHGNDGYYRMVKRGIPSKSNIHRKDITNLLNNDGLITVAMQEAVKARSYRSSTDSRHSVVPRLYRRKSNYAGLFNDEFWNKMWYLQDFRTNMKQPVMDMNVVPVFLILGITGEGVNITVPDDGFETSHPEMKNKFKPELSWNYISNNPNILPNKDMYGNLNSHGTRCAGEIVMQPNNTLCGVGVAYGANIGGIKFLDNKSTDAREAKVLVHALDYVSIYSNSWGPSDTGLYMEHLSDVVKKSLGKGISQGRDGKGTIYVFAAGNGKSDGDNCACDGYISSIYTVVVASCDDSGHVTHYSERCAAILTTAYSGAGFEKNVVTTDVNGKCTEKHTGTSAAAPLVSGIIALGLSANPTLSWRDVQHLIARTSQIAPLSDNYGWNLNAAGFYYSVDFGFGLMNAFLFVQEAQKWKNVPEMSSCGMRLPKVKGFLVSRNSAARITVNSDGCKGSAGEINFLEYVQLVVTMSYPKRGDIQISMRSPSGTECRVLERRPNDSNRNGLRRWTFTILAFWGESPNGYFVIDIFDTTGPVFNKGIISEMTLSLHGTKDPPDAYKYGFRSYNTFTLAKPGDKPRFTQFANEGEVHVSETQDAEPLVDDHLGSQVQNDDKKKRVEYVQMADNFMQNVLPQHGETSRKNDAQRIFESMIETMFPNRFVYL